MLTITFNYEYEGGLTVSITVSKTKEEWIEELAEDEINYFESVKDYDEYHKHLLIEGFKGYKNMTDEELSGYILEGLYHFYENLTEV